MTFKDLFLCDLDRDQLQELLQDTTLDLPDALTILNINMDANRALDVLAADNFLQCPICGYWHVADINQDGLICWECRTETELFEEEE